jgi:hypothetical protein
VKSKFNVGILCGLLVIVASGLGIANAQVRPQLRNPSQRTTVASGQTWRLLSTDLGVYRYDTRTGKTEIYRRTKNGPTECEWAATLDLKSVPEAGETGRYEVVEAKGSNSDRTGLLVRFDHRTGRTWSYASGGGLYEWLETQKK